VLDFGVAKLVAPLGDVPMTTTVEGTIVGTPAYMAPEQATGGNADARTDLYSVGVVLYELLAGHPPFQAPAFGQLVAQVLSSPPPPVPGHTRSGERIPHALGSVVKRCLAKNPEDRYPSLRELARALEVAAQAPVRRGPPGWMRDASPPRWRSCRTPSSRCTSRCRRRAGPRLPRRRRPRGSRSTPTRSSSRSAGPYPSSSIRSKNALRLQRRRLRTTARRVSSPSSERGRRDPPEMP